jgi:glycosyltransferase involved in cell wall biosynthesis
VRLVQALAASGAHLLMLGDGPERAAVERAARELGLAERVRLVGHRAAPQDDYRAMDVFALSSDTEQMPVALLEAMASALPVAATDVGDVRRILPDEQGEFLVPLASGAEALGHALARLAADAPLRARLGSANRARVAHEFGFERMVAAYREVYGRALAG